VSAPVDRGDLLKEAAARLRAADRVVAMTGAGISAESGIPTFRGEDGLWRHYRAEELASPSAFARDPDLVWEWYNWRRELIAAKSPNPGHRALVEIERRAGRFVLVTQNVDGLHHAAGSRNVVELHGNIWRVRCTGCGTERENRDVPIPIPPRCEGCGGLLRPGVVWFGESLPEGAIEQAFAEAAGADVALVIGTSGVVQPAASLVWAAKGAGAFVVEINLDPTPHTETVDVSILGKAGETLPALVEEAYGSDGT
jgi:NAD-dependent deacetylase